MKHSRQEMKESHQKKKLLCEKEMMRVMDDALSSQFEISRSQLPDDDLPPFQMKRSTGQQSEHKNVVTYKGDR